MRASLVAIVILGSGCPQAGEPRVPAPPAESCIEVEPAQVDFGAVAVGAQGSSSAEREITVRNRCEGMVELRDLQLADTGLGGIFSVKRLESLLLAAGESTTFVVEFRPTHPDQVRDRVVVLSSANLTPRVTVDLIGSGIAPVIDVTPESVDYGSPLIGCGSEQAFTLRNTGNADLIVEEIRALSPSADEFRLELDPLTNGPLPFLVPAQSASSVQVYVDYQPLDAVPDEAILAVTSNDPIQPETTVRLAGTGVAFEARRDTFDQPLREAADVLFTLNRSASMAEELEALNRNIHHFTTTLDALDVDYHLSAVVDDSGCIVGPDPAIDSSFDASEARAAFRTMADVDFTLSSYGSNIERGFSLAETALSERNVSPGRCNSDFYREDASLTIVHVSDSEEPGYASWSYYVTAFQSLKARSDDVLVHAIAGDYPTGCDTASAGRGYHEATVATGGLFRSICSADWETTLQDLAVASHRGPRNAFPLSASPVPKTIRVRVDGAEVSSGWAYDLTTGNIVFEKGSIPAGGSTIEVLYALEPRCP